MLFREDSGRESLGFKGIILGCLLNFCADCCLGRKSVTVVPAYAVIVFFRLSRQHYVLSLALHVLELLAEWTLTPGDAGGLQCKSGRPLSARLCAACGVKLQRRLEKSRRA